MAERQAHGFNYEAKVIERYNMTPETEYTGKWDAYYNGIPVSIKNKKFGSDIEMADYFRNSTNTDNFYLIVGFWKGKKTNIVEEHFLYIQGNEYHTLFNVKINEKLKNLLENITNDKSDDAKWRIEIAKLKKEWKDSTPNLVRLRFKRDHKTQKRIQCAINNKDFYDYFCKRYEVNFNGGRNQISGAEG